MKKTYVKVKALDKSTYLDGREINKKLNEYGIEPNIVKNLTNYGKKSLLLAFVKAEYEDLTFQAHREADMAIKQAIDSVYENYTEIEMIIELNKKLRTCFGKYTPDNKPLMLGSVPEKNMKDIIKELKLTM